MVRATVGISLVTAGLATTRRCQVKTLGPILATALAPSAFVETSNATRGAGAGSLGGTALTATRFLDSPGREMVTRPSRARPSSRRTPRRSLASTAGGLDDVDRKICR